MLLLSIFLRKENPMKEYIDAYKEALRSGDEKSAKRIERELRSLGIDYATLQYLVKHA